MFWATLRAPLILLLFCTTAAVLAATNSPDSTFASESPAATTQIFLEKCQPQCRKFLSEECDESCQCTASGLRDTKDCLQCQVDNVYFDSQEAADARFESINATCVEKGFLVVISTSSGERRIRHSETWRAVSLTSLAILGMALV